MVTWQQISCTNGYEFPPTHTHLTNVNDFLSVKRDSDKKARGPDLLPPDTVFAYNSDDIIIEILNRGQV